MILAGDIGATNSRLGLFDIEGERLVRVASQRFENRTYASIDQVLDAFDVDQQRITNVCLGIAGPIVAGKANITNLQWDLDVSDLGKRFPGSRVALLNDVEATAYGVLLLTPEDVFTLNSGIADPRQPVALIASGTGLGECILLRSGARVTAIATEAGHSDFAPNDDLETEFLVHMRRRFGHVSLDRVLSGPGLLSIYDFLSESGRGTESPELASRMVEGDPSKVIAEAALNGESELCSQALNMFVAIYGAEAGNLALRTLARGGVFVAGGIAPKIRNKVEDGTFMRAFTAKGRMAPLLATIPVNIVLNDDTALLGAAHFAMSSATHALRERLPDAGAAHTM
jgi:glucokinase